MYFNQRVEAEDGILSLAKSSRIDVGDGDLCARGQSEAFRNGGTDACII